MRPYLVFATVGVVLGLAVAAFGAIYVISTVMDMDRQAKQAAKDHAALSGRPDGMVYLSDFIGAEVGKFCDAGRAVYVATGDSGKAIAVVQAAPECGG